MKRRRLPHLLLSTTLLASFSGPADALTDAIWVGGSGNWSNAAMWNPATVPSSSLYNVLLDNGNALNSIVDFDAFLAIGGLKIDAGDTLRINNGAGLVLSNAMVNNAGTLLINPNGSTTYTYIDGTVNLQGTGTVTLGGSGHGQLRFYGSGSSDTLNNFQTIDGSGAIAVLLNNQTGGTVDANINAGTLGLYFATTNSGTLRASNGGTLSLIDIAVANSNGVITATSGGTVNLGNSIITGGTLTNSGGTINSGGNTFLTGSGVDGITLNGGYTLGNGAITTVTGTFQNNGVVNFAASGSTTYLLINGAVNLQGSGNITMGGTGPNQIRYKGDPVTDTLNNYQTIQGHGDIAVNLNNTTGQLVDANISGTTLGLHGVTTNAGTLRASNGGTLSINNITVANTGGVITATSGGTVKLNSSTITGGTLTNSGGTINFGNAHLNGTVGGGITLNGTLTITNGTQPKVSGTIQNNGVIDFAAEGSTTYLLINGAVNLQGSGSVTMGGTGPNQIQYFGDPLTDVINNAQTIQGKGTIAVKLNNQSAGLVNANISGQTLTLGANLTNTGTLRASNGGALTITTTTVTNVGGLIQAQTSSTVNFATGSVIHGGTVQNSGGTFNFGSVTLDGTDTAGITLQGTFGAPGGSTVTLVNTIHNQGGISLNSGGSTTVLRVGGNGTGVATLLDGGTITLGATGTGSVLSASSSGNRLINENNTIQGQGIIGNSQARLTNRGLIDANVSGGTLVLSPDVVGSTAFNSGTIRASNGGTLSIQSSIANSEGSTNGTIEATAGGILRVEGITVSGGTVRTVGSGQIKLATGTVTGGSLLNSSTGVIRAESGISKVAGLNNSAGGQVIIDNGAGLVMQGAVQNDGTVLVNPNGSVTYGYIDGSVTLQGAGKLTLGGSGHGQLRFFSDSSSDTLNSSQTIDGSGAIAVKLNNQAGGVVDSNVNGSNIGLSAPTTNAGTLRASNSATLSLNDIMVANVGGLITATTGSTVNLNNSTITGGTLTNSGGSINSGNAHLNGAISGGITLNGTLRIGDGNQPVVSGAFQNNGVVDFASSGSTTSLLINGAVTLQGTTGRITMDGTGPNQIRYNGDPVNDSLTSEQRIEGKGTIGVNLVNQSTGVVDANLSGQTLSLLNNVTNTGTLQASGEGTLSISAPVITNVGGAIQALASSTVNFSGGTRIDGGTVRNNSGAMTFGSNVTFDGTDAAGITLQGAIPVPNGIILTLLNTVHNEGTLSITPGGSNTYLQVGGDGSGTVTLDGGGTVSLTSSSAVLDASHPGNRLVNVDNTISGVGSVGMANMKLTNAGLIHANDSNGGTLTVIPEGVAGGGINTGTMRASGGGVLTISNTIENNGGTVEALADSRVNVISGTLQQSVSGVTQVIGAGEVRLSSGQVLGGSLLNSATGIIRSASGTSRINTLTNPVGGQVIVDNATTLALQGTLTNNGSIAVNGAGSPTRLGIEGTVTLLGTGSVTLGASFGGTLGWGSDGLTDLLVNPQQTIEGKGTIDVRLNNQSDGIVRANVSGQTLGMYRNVTNSGLLLGTGGATLSLNDITVNNAGGLILTNTGGVVNLNASTIIGGTISSSGTGGVFSGLFTVLDGATAAGSVTTTGKYNINTGEASIVKGTINNTGTISMNGDGSIAYLLVDGVVSLEGSGKVTMNNVNGNLIRYNTSGSSDWLINKQTIEGRGTIGVLLQNSAGKLIDANVPGQTLGISASTINDPTAQLRASNGGTLSLNSITVTNIDATIRAQTGSTVLMNNSTIYGGLIDNQPGGSIFSGSSTFLDGSVSNHLTLQGTYTLGDGAATALKGTINNNGLINYNALGSTASLLIDGAVNLQGTGKVTMGGAGPNQIRYNGNPASDTLNSYQTIEGKGTIAVLFNNTPGHLVDANINGQTLSLTATTTNGEGSVIQSSNSGTLSLNNISVTNIGASIQAVGTGATVELNASTIHGGTLINAGGTINSGNGTFLDGSVSGNLTILGTYRLDNGDITALRGTINNGGNINYDASGSPTYLLIDGTVDLRGSELSPGSGAVTMGGTGANLIRFNGSPTGDGLNNYQTIQGKGTIDVIMENKATGVVNANLLGQTLDINRDLTNRGVLRAENGGKLSINGITASTGEINSRAGSQVSFNSSSVLLDQGTTITGPAQTRLISGTTFIGDSAADTIPTSNFLVAGGTLTGDGRMNVSESFTLTAGTVSGSGNLNLLSGSNNTINGASNTIDARPVNNQFGATLTMNVDSLTLRGGTVISNDGTLNVQGNTTVNGNANGGSIIDNNGTLHKTGTGTATLNTTLDNTGTVEVQSGRLVLNGVSNNSGAYVINNDTDSAYLDFGSGTHNFNTGTTITGTGQARINGGGTVNVNATTHAADIALVSGVIQGAGNLIVDRNMYWSAGTMYGSGQAVIASGATMEIATSDTKFLHGRDLVNHGTVNWSGGTINAAEGASFYNQAGGNLGITGNVTFTRADEDSSFINNGNLAVPSGSSLTINADFTNNGRVEQGSASSASLRSLASASAAGGTVTVNGNIKGNGVWDAIGSFLNWVTDGIFGPKTVNGTTNVVGGQLNITGDQPVIISGSGSGLIGKNGAAILGQDAASILGQDAASLQSIGVGTTMQAPKIEANNGAVLEALNGGTVRATGKAGILGQDAASMRANGAGSLLEAPKIAANNGAFLEASNGGTVRATGTAGILGQDAASMQANGTGSLLEAPKIEVKNGTSLQALNGGTVMSTGPAGILGQDAASLQAANGGAIVAGGGGNIVAGGGGNIVAGGGGNIVAGGGMNLTSSSGGTLSLMSAGESLTPKVQAISSALFTGPMILAQDGGNLIGHTGGTFTGNVVAESGGSLLPGDAGGAGTMTINGGLDLQAGSSLKLDLLQGGTYDFLTVSGMANFNGNLILNMAYALRTLSAIDQLLVMTAGSPISGIIGNMVGGRVSDQEGLGSFKVTYGTDNNLKLDDFHASALTYGLWAGAWNLAGFGDTGFNADPDGDGIRNGLEYALGMDPLTPDAPLAPTVSVINVSGSQYLALTYVRQAGVNLPTDLLFAVERSTNLSAPNGGWSPAGLVEQSVTAGPEAGFETVVVRSSTPIGTPGVKSEFLRLSVTLTH